jgi:hypothetical protein
MSGRIDNTLAEKTAAAPERAAPRRPNRRNLREQLKAGYRANASEGMAITQEWFPLEEEAWRGSRGPRKRAR